MNNIITSFKSPEQSSEESRGYLIVFEGCDGVGKTTQSKLLTEVLNEKQKTIYMTFPDRSTRIGKIINDYLKKETQEDVNAINLLFSANRLEKIDFIIKNLKSGNNIIIDRYSYSGIVYAATTNICFYNNNTSISEKILNGIKGVESIMPKPDIVIYLEGDSSLISSRNNFGNEIYESTIFQEKIKENYTHIFDYFDDWFIININSKSILEIHKEILDKIQNKIYLKNYSKIKKLYE